MIVSSFRSHATVVQAPLEGKASKTANWTSVASQKEAPCTPRNLSVQRFQASTPPEAGARAGSLAAASRTRCSRGPQPAEGHFDMEISVQKRQQEDWLPPSPLALHNEREEAPEPKPKPRPQIYHNYPTCGLYE